jgi:molecular chaperone GrpE
MPDENTQKVEETEEVTIEQDENLDDSVIAEESAQETVKKLREKLKKCVEEKQEYLTGWQKDKAEFLNARKRDTESQKQFLQFANENLVTELIPVLDSFDTAFSNKEAWEKVDLNWRMGVQYIYSQMLKILGEHKVTVLDPKGEDYNPNLHEAVELIETQKPEEDGKILIVMNKGYTLNGKVIRPPKVKVGELKK